MVVHKEMSFDFILRIYWHLIHECYTLLWISGSQSNCQVNPFKKPLTSKNKHSKLIVSPHIHL